MTGVLSVTDHTGGIHMKQNRTICAVLLALTVCAGMTACSQSSRAESGSAESAAETAESSSAAVDKAARPTADGIYISKEGVLKVPEEITLKDTKATVSKEQDSEGDYRIQAVTGEIEGVTYTISEAGVVPATYVRVLNDHDNAYMFGVSGHAVAAELFEDGSANYVINISSEQCIWLNVAAEGLDAKEAKRRFEKQFSETAELYDTLITDFISASEIAWDDARAED